MVGFPGALIGVFGILGGYNWEVSVEDGKRYVRISPPDEERKISLSLPHSLFVTYTSVPIYHTVRETVPGGALTAMIV